MHLVMTIQFDWLTSRIPSVNAEYYDPFSILYLSGPSVLAVKKITEMANALGLVGNTSTNNDSNSDNNYFMI